MSQGPIPHFRKVTKKRIKDRSAIEELFYLIVSLLYYYTRKWRKD